jgi:hypothetical protein
MSNSISFQGANFVTATDPALLEKAKRVTNNLSKLLERRLSNFTANADMLEGDILFINNGITTRKNIDYRMNYRLALFKTGGGPEVVKAVTLWNKFLDKLSRDPKSVHVKLSSSEDIKNIPIILDMSKALRSINKNWYK